MVKLTNLRKAAILLISLGPDKSASLLKHLREEEIERLTAEISKSRWISSKVKENVLKEFHQLASQRNMFSQGGVDFAKELLHRTIGEDKANDIIKRVSGQTNNKPFYFAHKAEPVQIINFLQYENAQTIALVLSYLDPEKAAAVLSAFSSDKQIEIAKKIALMDTASPEMIQQVEQVLQDKLMMTATQDYSTNNGIESIVSILNGVDRATEKNILEKLEIENPELASEIKKRMFVFEDIAFLDNRSIQRILRDVENNDLELALRIASEDLKTAVFNNISKRRAEMLQEELLQEIPVQVKEIEDAQSRIVSLVRKLEEEGDIIIHRDGVDDIVF
jgi:flagellar motor switch protein FliG